MYLVFILFDLLVEITLFSLILCVVVTYNVFSFRTERETGRQIGAGSVMVKRELRRQAKISVDR